ncbi:MCE family protein [Allorhizocola rhizosphaerae]|uniref:MCE family protein n=1 Tax=Allorhizocola rhizosphaerae TaxID=1872709 RepID=UPI001FEC1EE8|nr:MCE family protein [Allorhizocola rhizosphaerae]
MIHVPLALLLVLGGCTAGTPGFTVTAEFDDVLDLVPRAAVKVNDVTVGSVEEISLRGWTAVVKLRVDPSVKLPDNATAAIRQSSLLGEKFVALAAPEQTPAGELSDGDLIPLERTKRAAEVEEVLAALGMVLNGSGLANLKTINHEVAQALEGREGEAKEALRNLDKFIAGLDDQKDDIVKAIDALDRLTTTLAQQRQTIGEAVEALDPGLSVLAEQRAQLTSALTALDRLSVVGTNVIEKSREDTLASLKALQPLLDQLVKAGDDLPKSFDFMLTYPFPPNVQKAIRGNQVNLHATLDLDSVAFLTQSLIAPPDTPLLPGLPGLPNLPLPSLPIPLPSLPLPSLPPLLPGPSGSPLLPLPSLPLHGGGRGGLYDILSGGLR